MLSVGINCEELPLSFHKTLLGFFSSATSKPVASFRLPFLEKVPPYRLFSRLWIQVPASHLCPKCPHLFSYSCFFLYNDLLDIYTSLVILFYIPPGFLPQPLGWFKAFVFLGYILHSWWKKSCSVLPSSWTHMFLEGRDWTETCFMFHQIPVFIR